jgi:hypothetical protein
VKYDTPTPSTLSMEPLFLTETDIFRAKRDEKLLDADVNEWENSAHVFFWREGGDEYLNVTV